jgi:hypothetical protein
MGERWYREQLKPRTRQKAVGTDNFGATGDRLRKSGFVPIPLTGKRPIPNGWAGFWLRPPSDKTYAAWRKNSAGANVGICLGEVVAIDIDIDDQVGADNSQELVFSLLGPTPFIRIGRPPRRTLFYRLPHEQAQQTSSWKVGPVEMLAEGKQSAVFGIHPDTQMPFHWPQRSILGASVTDIPLIASAKLKSLKDRLSRHGENDSEDQTIFTLTYVPQSGQRNDYLFWFSRQIADECPTKDILSERLRSRNLQMPDPLPAAELDHIARSTWRYKRQGTLLRSGRNAPVVLPFTREIGLDRFRKLTPKATKLYLVLIATRDNRQAFTIPQKRTAEYLGCGVDTVSKAIKELMAVGLLVFYGHKRGGSSNWRAAKLYRFGYGTAIGDCPVSSVLL